MRPVYFYGAMSLDGYLADEHDDIKWLLNSNQGGVDTYSAFERKIDTLVMGRVSYDVTRAMLGDAPFYPGLKKVVLSRTRTGGDYRSGDVVQIVQQLQQESGRGIWIVGGGALVSELLAAGMISEWWLQIAPVVLGHGKRLFEPGTYRSRFELLDTTKMGELVELHLRYHPGNNAQLANDEVLMQGVPAMKVKLSDVVEGLESTNDEAQSFYDTQTGDVRYYNPDFDEEETGELLDSEPDRFIGLPNRFDIDDYRIMQEFIAQVQDERQQERLARAIHGRGAFRMFREVADELDLTQKWYDFKDAAYLQLARDWAAENQIQLLE